MHRILARSCYAHFSCFPYEPHPSTDCRRNMSTLLTTRCQFQVILLVLSLLHVGSVAGLDYPSFNEGDVNSTINVGAVVSETKTLRCTVKNDSDDSELEQLDILPPPGEGDNWELKKSEEGSEEKWAEVVIKGVSEDKNKGQTFTCTAINADKKTSELSYHVEKVYKGTTFEEGDVNATLSTDLTAGAKAQIKCTVKSADPSVTELSIAPPPAPGNSDYKIIKDGTKWVGIEFMNINSETPIFFTCAAVSDVTTANLHYSVSIFDGIKFAEGNTNGTVNQTLVTETTGSVIRCTVTSSDPEISELSFQPAPPPGNNDYKINKNGTYWVEVEFAKINDKTPTVFQCIAKNNITTATLDFMISIEDPIPPIFSLGGNDTIWNEIETGANHTFFCDVVPDVALPPVTSLTAAPPSGPGDNWAIDIKEHSSVEIKITGADSSKNKRDYICIATNGPRTTKIFFQNYVGGEYIVYMMNTNITSSYY